MSNTVFALQIAPNIPEPLRRLDDLAKNFWFSWNPQLGQLFRKLDPVLWRKVEGSPRAFLRCVDQGILENAATDPKFVAEYQRILAELDRYVGTGVASHDGLEASDVIAYFCAEFALHTSLPVYSGGLGVLAGDHCKEASDLGVPLIGIGFMYPQGYFHQHVSAEGWQEESYERLNWADVAIEQAQHRPRNAERALGQRRQRARIDDAGGLRRQRQDADQDLRPLQEGQETALAVEAPHA